MLGGHDSEFMCFELAVGFPDFEVHSSNNFIPADVMIYWIREHLVCQAVRPSAFANGRAQRVAILLDILYILIMTSWSSN